VHELFTGAAPQTPLAVYVGNRWLPRHVVLVVEFDATHTRVYDPSVGAVLDVSWARWRSGPLRLAGWDQIWGVLTPFD